MNATQQVDFVGSIIIDMSEVIVRDASLQIDV